MLLLEGAEEEEEVHREAEVDCSMPSPVEAVAAEEEVHLEAEEVFWMLSLPEDAAAETVAVEVLWLPLPPEVEEVSVCSDEFSNVCDRITIKPLILSKKVVGVGRSGRYR